VRAGEGDKVGEDELDPVGDAVERGVVPGERETGRRGVEGDD
jgi:hypothetical protein